MPRSAFLLVTHNSAGHIESCLDAVDAIRRQSDIVLVIDNASADGTGSLLAARHGIRLIQNSANSGFAGAVNQGFESLRNEADVVLLLNPDVLLTTPVDELSAACLRTGLACGRLANEDGTPQIGFSFRRFPTPAALFFETIGLNRIWKSNPVNRRYRCLDVDHALPSEVDQPAGAMLMVRMDVWVRLGGFDEQFHPVWFEDVDFCRRAKLSGCRAAYLPSVEGIHFGGHSVSQIPIRSRRRYWYASLLRYSRKHFGRAGRGLVAVGVAVAAMVRSVGTVLRLPDSSVEQTRMKHIIARSALVYPAAESMGMGREEVSAVAADVRSRVSNEGSPSTENTERTLKRLHAR